ncbi:MAG: hypothetical protein ACRCWM_09980 [Sarcina sp.]
MKKIVVLLIALIVAVGLTGCFKSDNLEENKIMAPVPKNMQVDGTWEVTQEYTIGDNNTVKKVDEIKKPIVTITNKVAIVGNMEIDKPNFKFKRVIKDSYLPKAFDGIVNDVPLDDGYMSIITISDNTNLNVDFILKNNNEAYIYAVGDLFVVKRINSTASADEIQENINSAGKVPVEQVDSSSGILLGLKTPATVNEDGSVTEASYETLWIRMIDGKLQEPIKMKGLVIPRANGTFSYANITNSLENGKSVQTLEIINHNKNGTPVVEKNVMPSSKNREITFIGKDYIGFEFAGSNNLGDEYKISTLDNVNSAKGLDIQSLFGPKGKEQYLNSRKQFIDSKPSFVLDQYNLNDVDTGDITMFRKNARWVVESRLDSNTVGVNDLSFDINISPVGSLVNYDSLPISWNKLKEVNPNITDAFSSPDGNFIVAITNNSIEVYEFKDGKIDVEPVQTIDLNKNDVAVMGEWATGDFVSLWNKAVEERNK